MTSGGPLQVSNDDQVNCTYTVFGVVSFGINVCGVIGGPGEFFSCRFPVSLEFYSFGKNNIRIFSQP